MRHNERKAAAEERRARRAATAASHPAAKTYPPTNSLGPTSARGDRRRWDRQLRNEMETPAAAAKRRHAEAKALLPRKPKAKPAPRLSPVPEDYFDWTKAKRRRWVADREIARQQSSMQSLVRRGVPEVEAKRRFGSL